MTLTRKTRDPGIRLVVERKRTGKGSARRGSSRSNSGDGKSVYTHPFKSPASKVVKESLKNKPLRKP